MIGSRDIAEQRQLLRQQLQEKRDTLSKDLLQNAAVGLLANLQKLQLFNNCNRISAYLAFGGEINPRLVLEYCWTQQIQTYLPVISKKNLVFAEYTKSTELVEGKYGIPIPNINKAEILAPHELDLVLTPLLGFDADGNRLGMGGGFYDRSFEFKRLPPLPSKPILCGIAHEDQRVQNIPFEEWDVRMDMVVTDQAIYKA